MDQASTPDNWQVWKVRAPAEKDGSKAFFFEKKKQKTFTYFSG
jgi:hypothetical protein